MIQVTVAFVQGTNILDHKAFAELGKQLFTNKRYDEAHWCYTQAIVSSINVACY